ncbi:MAG: hypothetical protein WCD44_01945 [Candidatus Babeliales bacterium]
MELRIITPQHTQKYIVIWIDLHTPEGNLVIQPNHAPIILLLSPGKEVTFCLKNGKQESVMVKQGIIEIMRTHATLLINTITLN